LIASVLHLFSIKGTQFTVL